MNRIKAEIIADSINEFGQRITTFVLDFPRIILSEFNTHRMISRNSASSRAIPFKTMLEKVKNEPFIPIRWMKEHKGMQGNEYLDDIFSKQAEIEWLAARDAACSAAYQLSEASGVTKQICNRILEPYLYHKCICTGTEWENFFALRAEDGAEIHIQELAYQMLDAYNQSTPKQLKAGEWHIPFGDKMDTVRLACMTSLNTIDLLNPWTKRIQDAMVKIATARCARVSYLNFEGKDDYEADIKLHDTLLKSGHMSPFEHCARAMTKTEMIHGTHEQGTDYTRVTSENPEYQPKNPSQEGWSGNFRGFVQYRKTIKGENKIDDRVKKKN
jgi:thymidylate synthase ThyX